MINNIYFIEDPISLEALTPYLRPGDAVVNAITGRRDIFHAKEISAVDISSTKDCDFFIVNIKNPSDVGYIYPQLDRFRSGTNRLRVVEDNPEIYRLIYCLDVPFEISPYLVHSSKWSYNILKDLVSLRYSNKEIRPFGEMIRSIMDDTLYIPLEFTLRGKGDVYFLDRRLGNINEGDIILKERAIFNDACKDCSFLKHCPSRISPEGCILKTLSFPFLFGFLEKIKTYRKENETVDIPCS